MKEAVLDVVAADRYALAIASYYLHELVSVENIPFTFVGYDQTEHAFVVAVGDEKVVSILNGLFKIVHEHFRFVVNVAS